MKKHVALTVLALTCLGVLNAHVDLPEIDGRRFVQAEGRLYDPLGWLQDRWTAWTQDCDGVSPVAAGTPVHRQALEAIRGFSPPDSGSARLLQVLAMGPWLLAEVEFDRLSPAVVLLQSQPAGLEVVEGAIWSGSTEPWRPAPLIRRHLRSKAPEAPEALTACLQPRGALFQPR